MSVARSSVIVLRGGGVPLPAGRARRRPGSDSRARRRSHAGPGARRRAPRYHRRAELRRLVHAFARIAEKHATGLDRRRMRNAFVAYETTALAPAGTEPRRKSGLAT